MTPKTRRLDPLEDELRQADHDRWLTTLFAAPGDRPALVALYAFNQEVAKTRERVSEPMVGEIRLEWWRETIAGLYAGRVREHPVAEALSAAVDSYALPEREFQEVIDARRGELYDESPKSFSDLLAYADASGGRLSRLAMRICGGGEAKLLAAADEVGRAWALTGLLRALGFQAAMRRTMLPAEDLAAAGIQPETLYTGEFPEDALPLARRMADAAREAIATARREAGRAPRRRLCPLLLAPLAEDYLGRLARAGGDPFAADFERGLLARQIKIAWAALRRRF